MQAARGAIISMMAMLGRDVTWQWEWEIELNGRRDTYRVESRDKTTFIYFDFGVAYEADCSRSKAEDLAGALETIVDAELCNVRAAFHRLPGVHCDYHTAIDKGILRESA